jgi:hypothetical protein
MCRADDIAMDTYDDVPLGVECAWPSAALPELQSVVLVVPIAPPYEATAMPNAPPPKR